MQLTKTFPAETFSSALESWAWLDLAGKEPVFASLFGDVFLEAADGWWFLDTLDGSLERLWPGHEELLEELATDRGQDRYLMGALAEAADKLGLHLGENDVYDLMPPPVLGGTFAVENVFMQSFVVAVNIAGQLHKQIRDMPPGAQITGIQLE
jgi:hypothetical protein